MALRKASSYSKRKARPFTRTSRASAKAYIKTVPVAKIAKYVGGSQKDYEHGKHPFTVKLVAELRVQMRDNAIEAARQYVIKRLETEVIGQYFLTVKVHPHHMLRENKTAAGAGADRMSSGMKHSYGVVIGRAALISPGQEIFFISCASEKAARVAREAISEIKSKLPGKNRVVFEKAGQA